MQTFINDFETFRHFVDVDENGETFTVSLGDANSDCKWTMCMVLWIHFAATAKLGDSLRAEWLIKCKDKPSQDTLLSVLSSCLRDRSTTHELWNREAVHGVRLVGARSRAPERGPKLPDEEHIPKHPATGCRKTDRCPRRGAQVSRKLLEANIGTPIKFMGTFMVRLVCGL